MGCEGCAKRRGQLEPRLTIRVEHERETVTVAQLLRASVLACGLVVAAVAVARAVDRWMTSPPIS